MEPEAKKSASILCGEDVWGERSLSENNVATTCTECNLHIRAYLYESHQLEFHKGLAYRYLAIQDLRRLLYRYPAIQASRVFEPYGMGCKTLRSTLKRKLIIRGGRFGNAFLLDPSLIRQGEDTNVAILRVMKPEWIVTVGMCLITNEKQLRDVWKNMMKTPQNIAVFVPKHIVVSAKFKAKATETIELSAGSWMVWVR